MPRGIVALPPAVVKCLRRAVPAKWLLPRLLEIRQLCPYHPAPAHPCDPESWLLHSHADLPQWSLRTPASTQGVRVGRAHLDKKPCCGLRKEEYFIRIRRRRAAGIGYVRADSAGKRHFRDGDRETALAQVVT